MIPLRKLSILLSVATICLFAGTTRAQTPVEPPSVFGQRFASIDAELDALKTDLADVEQALANVSNAIEQFRLSIGSATSTEPLVESSTAEPMVSVVVAEPAVGVVEREQIAAAMLETIQSSDAPGWAKRRAERVLTAKRGRLLRAKERAIDKTVDKLVTVGALVETPDGVQAAIDWAAVLEILKVILPFVMMFL